MKPSFPRWGNLAQRLIRNSEQNIDVQHVWVISDVTTKICKLAKMEKIVVTHISFHKVWRRVRANRWPIGELPSLRATRVLGKQKQKKKKKLHRHKNNTLKHSDWSSDHPFFFSFTQTAAYECMKPLSDGFVWPHWDKMHVINCWGWGFFFFLLRTFNSWSLLSLPESPLYFFWWIKQKKKKNPKHAESFAKWDISWLIRSFSHHITTATLSLSTSFFPHPLHRHPSGALFNSISSPPNFLSFSSCHSASHWHALSLFFYSSLPSHHPQNLSV